MSTRVALSLCAVFVLCCACLVHGEDGESRSPLLPNLPSSPTFSVNTIPANGDINPYGVAFVPRGIRNSTTLHSGDVLVSNFNNTNNLQGTGTTIVRIDTNGNQTLFFQGQDGLGLTTALGVLRSGLVLVGNLPSPTGSCTEGPNGEEQGVGQGSLLVIDGAGNLITQLADPLLLNGPWDLTVKDDGEHAQVFVSNALSGTVTRLTLRTQHGKGKSFVVENATQIASGYTHRCDPAALVVGPTGLALDEEHDVLYVASTGDNAIYAIPHASSTRKDQGTGRVVVSDATHLHGPLGLVRTANGDLVSSQGDAVNPDPNQPSEIVEFTAKGKFVSEFSIDSAPGSAFGMALTRWGDGFRFAAVDDGLNVLDIWQVK